MKLAAWFLAIFYGWASASIDAAESSDKIQQEFAAVGNAIGETQSWLSEAKLTQSEELQNLQRVVLQISTLSQSVNAAEAALAEIEFEIVFLSRKAGQLSIEKAAQSKILEQVIRTAYVVGSQSVIELLLNQEELSKSARILQYHKLFTRAQLDSIASFQKTFDEIQAGNQKLESNAADLENEQLTLSNSLQTLNDSKIKREIALAQLRANIASYSSQLNQLEIDQRQLQALTEQIN